MDDFIASLNEQVVLLRATKVHNNVMGDVKSLVAEAEILIEEAVRLASDYEGE